MMLLMRFILTVILWGIASGPLCAAAPDDTLITIDKNDAFDIYYGGDADGSAYVVKRVKIIRVQQINGVDFLVFINDAGFNAKSKEGYILFSTIKAMVPQSTFTIIGNERLK